jgi:hypothetical protein
LQQGALQFKRGATRVRKQMWWKNMKLNLILGALVRSLRLSNQAQPSLSFVSSWPLFVRFADILLLVLIVHSSHGAQEGISDTRMI